VQAAYFGFFVDMIEVYLPIAVTGARAVYFVPSQLSGRLKPPSSTWSWLSH
jgi:hypothetical protein